VAVVWALWVISKPLRVLAVNETIFTGVVLHHLISFRFARSD
jgi:hypothetical protein